MRRFGSDNYTEKMVRMMEKFFKKKGFVVNRITNGVSLIDEDVVVGVLIKETEIIVAVPSIREFNDPYLAFDYSFSYEKLSHHFQVRPFIPEDDYNKSCLSLRYSLPVFQPHDMMREVTTVDYLVQEALRFIREDKKLIDQLVNKVIQRGFDMSANR